MAAAVTTPEQVSESTTDTAKSRPPREESGRWPYQRAEAELIWRYTSAHAAIGFHGIDYRALAEPKGGTVDTGEKIVRLFDRARDATRKEAIDDTLRQLGPLERCVILDSYSPRGLPELLRAALSLSGPRFAVCLAGMVGRSREAHEARAKKKREHEAVLTFLDGEARAQNASLLKRVREELRGQLDRALAAYEPVRQERVEAERAEKKARHERWVDRTLGGMR